MRVLNAHDGGDREMIRVYCREEGAMVAGGGGRLHAYTTHKTYLGHDEPRDAGIVSGVEREHAHPGQKEKEKMKANKRGLKPRVIPLSQQNQINIYFRWLRWVTTTRRQKHGEGLSGRNKVL